MLVVLMIVLDFFSLIAMLTFICHTARKVAICLNLMAEPVYEQLRNQVKFRFTQLFLCHFLIIIFFVFLFIQSATLTHYYFT